MELYAAVQPMVLTDEGYRLIYGEDDPEEIDLMRLQDKDLATRISNVLRDLYFMEADFAAPHDGEGLTEEVGSVDDLHELRLFAAALQQKTPDDYYEGKVAPGFPFNHLINHSDDDGYYLPVDFPQAFFMDETSIGSAVVLLQELDALEAPLAAAFPAEMALALATPDDEERPPLCGPVGVWHALRRLCHSSLEMNLPIQFG